ncbi:uncharacterized protein LOC110459896 [Mizuhopecten yessoensis]|uniref:C-type lectin domain-containing protein n=1 Tax=Mizuhopecten yessoensis TaxID=6573 RepID=A0A210Q3B2_MIZYE|nr:uncharacterized protein LOC110459896 [Mizuhopecten yessoensis]OWF43226.1 hypothetical protein KP79_PYT18822 [Mizuhopecten yessoensis]
MELNIVFFVLNLCHFCVITVGHFRKQDGCPSSQWSMNIPRERCLKFYPEFHDFAHAEQLCQKDGSNIPYMDIDVDVTSAFQYLYLNFTNSSFQFWTRKHQSSIGRTVSKRTTNKAKSCEFIKMGREWNISRHTRNCNEDTAVLCEYIMNDSTYKLFPEDLYVLDTRDLVAIGAGIFIVAVFSLVVLMDIIKHIRSPERKTTDITRV